MRRFRFYYVVKVFATIFRIAQLNFHNQMRHYQRIFCYQHCCTLCVNQEVVRYRIQNTASAMSMWKVQKSRAMRWVEIYRLFAFNTPQFSWFHPFRWKQLQSRRLMVQHEKSCYTLMNEIILNVGLVSYLVFTLYTQYLKWRQVKACCYGLALNIVKVH